MQKARAGLTRLWNSLWDFRAAELTFPQGVSVLSVVLMFLFTLQLQWQWGILTIIATLLAVFVAFVYGKVLGHLIEETFYRLTSDEARLTDVSLAWGWIGIIAGVVVALTAPFDAPLTMRLVNLFVVNFIIWGGVAFPLMALRLNDEPTEPAEQ